MDFIGAKDDGGGGDKTYNAPVTSPPPINQHPVFTGQTPNQALKEKLIHK